MTFENYNFVENDVKCETLHMPHSHRYVNRAGRLVSQWNQSEQGGNTEHLQNMQMCGLLTQKLFCRVAEQDIAHSVNY